MEDKMTINGVEYVRANNSYTNFADKSKRVLEILGEEFMEILAEADAFIAGGAVLSVFTDVAVNDVDVYFKDKQSMATAFQKLTKDFNNIYLSHTDKSITLSDKETETIVQFIHFDFFETAQEIFDCFDFTVCMGAVSCKTGELFLSDQFMSDVASRTLHFNQGTRYPYISLIRVKKYEDKGYKIGKGHTLAIANACANLPITSWNEAKEQLGGIYGYEISGKMDRNEEFSSEEFNKVLTNLEERDWNPISSGTYEDLCDELSITSESK